MIEDKIKKLGYSLSPNTNLEKKGFVSVLVHDGYAYISGVLPTVDHKLPNEGKVGESVTIEDAKCLAKKCVINILANLKREIGSLNNVKQIIKLTGYIASEKNFIDQPIIMNEASTLISNIFEDKGRHARSAIGVVVLPKNSPIEIEMTVSLKN